MGLGRRSAPTAPPIPSRPLPPSAYGIGVPGAPVVPAQQPYAPPPPPSAPPVAAAPAFAPPTPQEPAVQYGAVQPSEPSASRFGGYAGPVNAFAPPPATQFGGPPPGQFGGPAFAGAHAIAQPQPGQWVPTGRPHRIHPVLAVVIGLVASFFVIAILAAIAIPSFLAQRMHHVGVLPATLAGSPVLTTADAQAFVARVEAGNAAAASAGIRSQQVTMYGDGTTRVLAEVAQVPTSYSLHPDAYFRGLGLGSSSDDPMHQVANGHWSGRTECGRLTTGGVICGWLDSGTMGLVVNQRDNDEAAALTYLYALRTATER